VQGFPVAFKSGAKAEQSQKKQSSKRSGSPSSDEMSAWTRSAPAPAMRAGQASRGGGAAAGAAAALPAGQAALREQQAWLAAHLEEAQWANLHVRIKPVSSYPVPSNDASDASAASHALAASSVRAAVGAIASPAVRAAAAAAGRRLLNWPKPQPQQQPYANVGQQPMQQQQQQQPVLESSAAPLLSDAFARPQPATSFRQPTQPPPQPQQQQPQQQQAFPSLPSSSSSFPPSRAVGGVASACKQSLQRSIPPTQQATPPPYAPFSDEMEDDDIELISTPSQTQHSRATTQQLSAQRPQQRPPQFFPAAAAAIAPLPLPIPSPQPQQQHQTDISEYADCFVDDFTPAVPQQQSGMLPASAFQRPVSSSFSGSSGAGGYGGGGSNSFSNASTFTASSSFGSSYGSFVGGSAASSSGGAGGSGLFQPVRPPLQQQQMQQSSAGGSPFGGSSISAQQQVVVSKKPPQCASVRSSVDAAWSRTDFPWSERLAEDNKLVFGNEGFRPHQREAINAALAGRDTFVLMPTGAGQACSNSSSIASAGEPVFGTVRSLIGTFFLLLVCCRFRQISRVLLGRRRVCRFDRCVFPSSRPDPRPSVFVEGMWRGSRVAVVSDGRRRHSTHLA
jgi:hypothetical protein